MTWGADHQPALDWESTVDFYAVVVTLSDGTERIILFEERNGHLADKLFDKFADDPGTMTTAVRLIGMHALVKREIGGAGCHIREASGEQSPAKTGSKKTR